MRALLADKSGNFAILTALVLPVLIFSVGLGIDYSLALDAHQRMKAAADAAALAAVGEAQEAYVQQEKADIKALIQSSGEASFRANIGTMSTATLDRIEIVPTVVKNELAATVTYRASYATSLLKVLGYPTIDISNTSRAVVNVRSFVNVNFLIDVSASMGIGATPADQEKVADAIGCAFACHIGEQRGKSRYDKARATGADMRIDVAREAAMRAVAVSNDVTQYDKQVTFGLYKFSNELTTIIEHDDPRSSDAQFLQTALAEGVQMDMFDGGTNIEYALKSLENSLPDSGSGVRADDRLQYVIVLTDGVEEHQSMQRNWQWVKHPQARENSPFKSYANHEWNYAMSKDACSGMRAKGIEVYFIYTEYLKPAYGEFSSHDQKRFGFVENELFPIIPKRFNDCTGDTTHVMKATTPKQIEDTFVKIVKDVSAPLRLY